MTPEIFLMHTPRNPSPGLIAECATMPVALVSIELLRQLGWSPAGPLTSKPKDRPKSGKQRASAPRSGPRNKR